MKSTRGFIVKYPFDEAQKLPLRIWIFRHRWQLIERFNAMPGAKCFEVVAYFAEARDVAKAKLSDRPFNEMGFTHSSFSAPIVAHECLHAVLAARRRGQLKRSRDGWEETTASALQRLTGIVLNRGRGRA